MLSRIYLKALFFSIIGLGDSVGLIFESNEFDRNDLFSPAISELERIALEATPI